MRADRIDHARPKKNGADLRESAPPFIALRQLLGFFFSSGVSLVLSPLLSLPFSPPFPPLLPDPEPDPFFEPPFLLDPPPPEESLPLPLVPLALPDDEASSGATLIRIEAYVIPGNAFCARVANG